MELLIPVNFLVSYTVIEIVTRTHVPSILTYVYSRQQYRVKIVTFFSKPLKACIVMMDVMHIVVSVYTNVIANYYPHKRDQCREEFETYYVFAMIVVIMGYMAVLRLLYLVFPHLIGYKYYHYRQSLD